MSSDNADAHADQALRFVYRSSRRVVATDSRHVAELSRESGWIRSIGTAGPMSGEKIASLVDGQWLPALSFDDAKLVEFASSNETT